MSELIEGEGIYRDYNGSDDGKPVFETTSRDKWLEYCKEKKITQSGQGPCVICNTIVTYTDLPVGKNPVCDNCKGDLVA